MMHLHTWNPFVHGNGKFVWHVFLLSCMPLADVGQ